MLAGQMTLAGELLLLAVVLGCKTWRCLLGAGAAPLTLFLSYGYMSTHTHTHTHKYVFLCFWKVLAVQAANKRDKMMPADLL